MRPAARAAVELCGVLAAAHFAPAGLGCPGVTRAFTRHAFPLADRQVLLTFDDGPHAEGTAAILDRLRARKVPALFFVVGEQLAAHPEMGRRIVDEGHDIGVHGWDHRLVPLTSPLAVARGIRRTVDAVVGCCGRPPRWYRPPYGVATGAALVAAHRAGLTPLWWTRWGRDWSRSATPQSVESRILRRRTSAPGGEILLLHDSDVYASPGSWRRTADAVDGIIDAVRARGQVFVSTSVLRATTGRR